MGFTYGAVFTDSISWVNLIIAGVLLGCLVVANWVNVRSPLFYALIGIVIWVSFFQSGIHPTIAGVLIAMVIPLRVEIDPRQFVDRARQLITEFDEDGNGYLRQSELERAAANYVADGHNEITPTTTGYTDEQLLAGGWTQEQIDAARENGQI